ncbi:MAG: hypothetical protein V3V08_12900 [Nannocystaceae bacterium]
MTIEGEADIGGLIADVTIAESEIETDKQFPTRMIASSQMMQFSPPRNGGKLQISMPIKVRDSPPEA